VDKQKPKIFKGGEAVRRGMKTAVVALLIAAVGGLSVIGCAGEVEEQTPAEETTPAEVWKIKYSTEVSELSFAFPSYYWTFQKEVEERSEGRIKITFYPSETLHKWPEFPEALQEGLVDMACCNPSYRFDVFPLHLIFQFPGLHRNEYESAIIWHEYLKDKWDVPYWDAIDAVSLADNLLEPAWILTAKKTISNMGDFQGFATPVFVYNKAYLEAVGVIPVASLYTERYEHLQKGMIDGVISMPDVITRMKWHTLCTPGEGCAYPFPIAFLFSDVTAAINKPFFQSMPTDLQEIIQTSADKWLSSANMQGNRIVSHLSKQLLTDMGLQYIEWSEEDIKEFNDLAIEKQWPAMYEEAAKYGVEEDLKQLVAEYQKYLDESQFDETMFKSLDGGYEVRDLTKGWEGVNEVLVDYQWFDAEEFVQ
jgi:TRAP-type C4-dicarboxylate transport system substrate-binding protein